MDSLRREKSQEDDMRKRKIAGWLLAVVIGAALLPALSQQDEGPILRPKPKPASATLLVMCDLACNWKLDGEVKGRIEAGGSAKAKVELGQHVVVAATEDGADQVKQLSEIKANGQTIVSIELEPVRDARLKAEKEIQAEIEHQERGFFGKAIVNVVSDQAAREQQEKDRQAKERAAQEELDQLIWIDPATGFMWTKHDNGFQLTKWKEAYSYCSTLRLAGFADWRWPTVDELASINNAYGLKGGIQVSGDALIGYKLMKLRKDGGQVIEDWTLYVGSGVRTGNVFSENQNRVLCVRRSGQ
jgi:hypothetical protein